MRETAGRKMERRREGHRQRDRHDGVTDRQRVRQWGKRNERDRMGFTAPICQS